MGWGKGKGHGCANLKTIDVAGARPASLFEQARLELICFLVNTDSSTEGVNFASINIDSHPITRVFFLLLRNSPESVCCQRDYIARTVHFQTPLNMYATSAASAWGRLRKRRA